PDEARASEPGPRADQYALAALAYECLTGTPVRDAPPLSRLLDGRGDIPLHVSQAVRRAMSSRPAERFPTVLDFVTALGDPTAAARRAVGPSPTRGTGTAVGQLGSLGQRVRRRPTGGKHAANRPPGGIRIAPSAGRTRRVPSL